MKSSTIQSLLKLNSAFITAIEEQITEARKELRNPTFTGDLYRKRVRTILSKLRKKLNVQVGIQKKLKLSLHEAYREERLMNALLALVTYGE